MKTPLEARIAWKRRLWNASLGLASTALVLLLLVPLVGLSTARPLSHVGRSLWSPWVVDALVLTLQTTSCSLAIIVVTGTPLAWSIARYGRPSLRWLEAAIELPIVVPPAVIGVALLVTFGRRGVFGSWLADLGLPIPLTPLAVVLAQVVVAAPFYVQAATAAFRGLDTDLLAVARSVGASPPRVFFRIALPLARRGLATGAALAWARALGEFGATLVFAGNLPGSTQTLPLAIYTALEADLGAAQSMALLLVIVAFSLLVLLRGRLVHRMTAAVRGSRS